MLFSFIIGGETLEYSVLPTCYEMLPTKWIGLGLNPVGDTDDRDYLDYSKEVWSIDIRVVLVDDDVQPRAALNKNPEEENQHQADAPWEQLEPEREPEPKPEQEPEQEPGPKPKAKGRKGLDSA